MGVFAIPLVGICPHAAQHALELCVTRPQHTACMHTTDGASLPARPACLSQLLGPICGPLVGGILAQLFGWRSTMVALAVFAGCVITPLLVCGVPETHQHRVLRRLLASHPELHVAEAQEILQQQPRFHAPWKPVLMLLQPDTVLHVLTAVLVSSTQQYEPW